MTCWKKDDHWSSCGKFCDGEGWNCTAVGNRTKLPLSCTWSGQECSETKLCCNIGFTCAVKDDNYAGCTQTVKKSTWFSQKVPIPAGWKGTVLGGGQKEYAQQGVDPKGGNVAGTRLYCFMAVLPKSPEVPLMEVAKANNASVFGCDGHGVFNSWADKSAEWDTGESTLINTDVFLNVFEQVKQAGEWFKYDWIVKVDPDAVLIPWRLKWHIQALHPPRDTPIYLKNNHMDPGLGNNGFLGAVEVFSKTALELYFDNWEGCKSSLGLSAGEDGFFKGCMDAMGVGYMTDGNMFQPDYDPAICRKQDRAAFHPLKKPDAWQCCWDIIKGKKRPVAYAHCTMPAGWDRRIWTK